MSIQLQVCMPVLNPHDTIKVWDAGARWAKTSPRVAPVLTPAPDWPLLAGSLTLMTQKDDAHSQAITSVAVNPDGTTIVSACNGRTIKVWDSGALEAPKSPLLGLN